MTEIQRIIEKGVISSDFLKEEIICDYMVTTELKKVWAVELDLFQEFKRVCEKYNLRYYAIAGTLLGAVRHKGFIPWDDDMDVVMPREDYDLLTKVYKDEFQHPYFMQTPYTDDDYSFSFCKLRNVNTCFASLNFVESEMNQGIFLDIFPLDYSSLDGYDSRREKIVNILRKSSAYMCRKNKIIKNKHTIYAEELSFSKGDNILFYEEIQKIASSVSKEDADLLAVETCTMISADKIRWPIYYYDSSIEVSFCNTTIKIPVEYELILISEYGDYMKYPPLEERGNHHSSTEKMLDVPYEEARIKIINKLNEQNR